MRLAANQIILRETEAEERLADLRIE